MPAFTTVSEGSVRSRSFAHRDLRVTDSHFPPGLIVPPHCHERPGFGVVLEGEIDVILPGTSRRCPVATTGSEPLDDLHSNRIGPRGARVLTYELDPGRLSQLEPGSGFMRSSGCFRHAYAAILARRAARELESGDGATGLVLESVLLELMVLATRVERLERPARGTAPWFRRTLERIHDRFLESITTDELAREANVHPMHLTRVFRAQVGSSIGEYVRSLRLDWAARRLTSADDPIAAIAHEAGFSDQSHFTRTFRRHLGYPPGEYRKAKTRRPRGR